MANVFTNLTHTILAQQALEAFTAQLTVLNAFATNFSAEAVQKGDKVKVAFVSAAAAAKTFAGTYETQDSIMDGLDILINKHEYVSWGLTDTELSTQPQLSLERFARQKGFQLAKKVLQDIWSLVTNANYGAAAFTDVAANFDADDVVDIGEVCDAADWPEMERSLILKSNFHAALRKDNALQDASALGTDSVIRHGKVPTLDTFGAIYKSTLIPANGENLVGFAVHPDAILVAMRYLQPQDNRVLDAAEPVTDPDGSGITLGFREWYEAKEGAKIRVLEANYGYLKGNGAAIKRMVSS